MIPTHGDTIEGVEERLQPGEAVLWSGRPDRSYLARHVLHVRGLVAYFLVLLAVPALVATPGARWPSFVASAWWVAMVGGGILLLAWFAADLMARTTIYAITDRRIVMRIGIAIPVTLNLPLDAITGVAMRERRSGTGDLALQLKPGQRIAFVLLWPHARPWRVGEPQPALRGIPSVATVGATLRRALGGAEPVPAVTRASSTDVRAPQPALVRP